MYLTPPHRCPWFPQVPPLPVFCLALFVTQRALVFGFWEVPLPASLAPWCYSTYQVTEPEHVPPLPPYTEKELWQMCHRSTTKITQLVPCLPLLTSSSRCWQQSPLTFWLDVLQLCLWLSSLSFDVFSSWSVLSHCSLLTLLPGAEWWEIRGCLINSDCTVI